MQGESPARVTSACFATSDAHPSPCQGGCSSFKGRFESLHPLFLEHDDRLASRVRQPQGAKQQPEAHLARASWDSGSRRGATPAIMRLSTMTSVQHRKSLSSMGMMRGDLARLARLAPFAIGLAGLTAIVGVFEYHYSPTMHERSGDAYAMPKEDTEFIEGVGLPDARARWLRDGLAQPYPFDSYDAWNGWMFRARGRSIDRGSGQVTYQHFAVGWPFPMMYCVYWRYGEPTDMGYPHRMPAVGAIEIGSRSGFPKSHHMNDRFAVPYLIRWPSLIATVLVWYLLVAGAYAVARSTLAIVRLRRLASGRCPVCCYPVQTEPRCPECGAEFADQPLRLCHPRRPARLAACAYTSVGELKAHREAPGDLAANESIVSDCFPDRHSQDTQMPTLGGIGDVVGGALSSIQAPRSQPSVDARPVTSPPLGSQLRWVAATIVVISLVSYCTYQRAGRGMERRSNPIASAPSDRSALLEVSLPGRVELRLVRIATGEFLMGSGTSEAERSSNEGPQHKVLIARSFAMGVTEVTQAQWESVMGLNPSYSKGPTLPVERVSWFQAVVFCNRLTEWVNASGGPLRTPYYAIDGERVTAGVGTGFRLPTEAEWEYACRAGTQTPFHFGSTISMELANYDGNDTHGSGKRGLYRSKTTPVGAFAANAWGLHDMHGNVSEWCWDWYDSKEYTSRSSSSVTRDPTGPVTGEARVVRGGSWFDAPAQIRSVARNRIRPKSRSDETGFRVCLDLQP